MPAFPSAGTPVFLSLFLGGLRRQVEKVLKGNVGDLVGQW